MSRLGPGLWLGCDERDYDTLLGATSARSRRSCCYRGQGSYRRSALARQFPQISTAHLRDAAQLLLAAGRVLSRCQASVHGDQTLDVPTRHRRAHEAAAKAILPFLDTFEKTQANYTKEITKLHELLDVPGGEFSELTLAEARSKLIGMQPHFRFAAIKKSIEKGSDLLVAVITKSDEFLVGDLLNDGEREEMISKWRAAKFPDQYARLVELETDFAKVEGAGKIMDGYLRSCANQSIVAGGDLPPVASVRGTGPAPTNRAAMSGMNSLNPAERAKATGRMIAASQGR